MIETLTTKLYIPKARHNLVPRPRLIKRLLAGMEHKLTLISAPPGFGKTTMLSEWIPQSERCVTWVSLDDGDNDPVRFWTYFIAALQMLDTEIGKKALVLLQSPQPPPIEAILTILLNEITGFQDYFAHVLDDYQVIQTQAVHTSIQYFLEHIPPKMHLVIASRTDPPLLARLRARDQLIEIRSEDLRFTPDETAAFLNQSMGLNLSPENVNNLEAHTEGWIAGLQLAGLALQGHGPQPDAGTVSEFIKAFTGSHRYIVSYLVEEVLSQLPKGTVDFLLQTSILDSLSGSLCDFVLGKTNGESSDNGKLVHNGQFAILDSQSMLEQLDLANMFIVSLDEEGKWYRYHHLFAEVLHARLQRSQPDRLRELHLRASMWYEESGTILKAVTHALEAKEWERAARLIEQIVKVLTEQMVEAAAPAVQVQTVLSWINMLPGIVIHNHPTLCLYHATMLMFTNQLEGAETWLQETERCIHPGMPSIQADTILGWVALIRADIARVTGDLDRGAALALQALELLPEQETHARAVARVNLTHRYLVTGHVTQSEEKEAAEAILPVQRIDNRFATLISTTNLARLQALQGKLHQAADTFAIAEQVIVGEGRVQELLNSAAYYIGLGDVLREWNQLEAAQQHLTLGMDLVQGTLSVDADVVTAGYVALAKLKLEQGDPAGGIRVLGEFVQLAGERNFFTPLIARGVAMQAQILLWQGNLADSLRWMEESELHHTDMELPYPHEVEYLTMARVMIAQGQTREALRLLDRLLQYAEVGKRIDSMIRIQAFLALAFYAQGEFIQATTILDHALSLAEPEGYIRVFVDEGDPMRSLISDFRLLIEKQPHRSISLLSYIDRLLAAFPGKTLPALPFRDRVNEFNPHSAMEILPESLSDRELAVLRLIAAGASNAEIAKTLIIAISTVKRHTGNIYGKLGVNSRTQAIVRARQLALLG